MPTITFTATAPNGETFTRTSGTMPYTSVLMVADPGTENWAPYSWHRSEAAAHKAANGTYVTRYQRRVVPAVPTSVQGKVTAGQFADWPAGCEDLVTAKLSGRIAL